MLHRIQQPYSHQAFCSAAPLILTEYLTVHAKRSKIYNILLNRKVPFLLSYSFGPRILFPAPCAHFATKTKQQKKNHRFECIVLEARPINIHFKYQKHGFYFSLYNVLQEHIHTHRIRCIYVFHQAYTHIHSHTTSVTQNIFTSHGRRMLYIYIYIKFPVHFIRIKYNFLREHNAVVRLLPTLSSCFVLFNKKEKARQNGKEKILIFFRGRCL